MKRILLPAGGAVLATGLLAAGLAGTANAVPDWAYDTMAKDAPAALDVAHWWLDKNGETNNLAKATAYNWETKATPKLNAGGGYVADGKPGSVKPIGEEGKAAAKVKNINLPKTIGKVFFVDENDDLKWCSASSIQSKYHNLVATAGHCVYDTSKNASVMDKWVFVPGYYQGKTPWGIYVGKTAYTHYDFSAFNDYDRDISFVTVYNGIQVGGGTAKEVSEKDFKAYAGVKDARDVPITEAEYKKTVDLHGGETSAAWAKAETLTDPVGPNHPDAVLALQEVDKDAYDKAPEGYGVSGAKAPWATTVENVTKSQYEAYKGPGYRKIDANGNFTITHYYLKYWVKKTNVKSYYKTVFFIVEGFIKDVGRLGDNVGGQGFTWNQKPQQTVFVFGYAFAPHPDGNKPYTGLTPKWSYGKTNPQQYVNAATKVEEHIGLKSALTPGADGGPWLAKYSNAKRLGYINGVTSLFADTDGNRRIDLITSPYFNGETYSIYSKAANVWSGSIVK